MSPRPQMKAPAFKYDLDLAAKEAHLSKIHEEQTAGKTKLWTNDVDRQEIFTWIFMAVLYVVALKIFFKMGLTMDMVVIALMFSSIWEVTVAKWKINYADRTLCLRKRKEDGGEMLKTQAKKDPFRDDEDKVILHLSDHIDYAVMKYVGDDVPMIVEQEYGHATMHHEAQKVELEEEENQKWLEKNHAQLNFFRKMILRRGERLGRLMCGVWEASNLHGMMFQAMCGLSPGKIARFHFFEEVEHAAVTVQRLKQDTTAFERFLFFPLVCGMMLPAVPTAILPPIARDPSLLLKLETYPQMLAHTVKSIGGTFGFLLSVLLHYVLPFPIPQSLHDMTHAHFERMCKEAGIEWEVTKKVTYPLYL